MNWTEIRNSLIEKLTKKHGQINDQNREFFNKELLRFKKLYQRDKKKFDEEFNKL